jgi:hypothetical protein
VDFGVFIMKLIGMLLFMIFSLFFNLAYAAGGPDFSGLTAQVDWTTAIAALLLVMGGLAGVYIVWTGGSLILAKLKRGG